MPARKLKMGNEDFEKYKIEKRRFEQGSMLPVSGWEASDCRRYLLGEDPEMMLFRPKTVFVFNDRKK